MDTTLLKTGLRHELKLLLSYADYLLLRARLSAVMPLDKHSQNGEYSIRSLYLDDVYNSAYNDKLIGIQNRKKYRLRCYNGSDSLIKLECKQKYGARIQKTSAVIDLDCYKGILVGDYTYLEKYDNPLCRELLSQSTALQIKPSVIVDYEREAFTYPVSNVRLTFDKNLRAGISSFDMFDKDLLTYNVYQNKDVIFEVKYDDFIPKFISDMVSQSFGSKIALSKYCMCKDVKNIFSEGL